MPSPAGGPFGFSPSFLPSSSSFFSFLFLRCFFRRFPEGSMVKPAPPLFLMRSCLSRNAVIARGSSVSSSRPGFCLIYEAYRCSRRLWDFQQQQRSDHQKRSAKPYIAKVKLMFWPTLLLSCTSRMEPSRRTLSGHMTHTSWSRRDKCSAILSAPFDLPENQYCRSAKRSFDSPSFDLSHPGSAQRQAQ